jgi:hypothetical protein
MSKWIPVVLVGAACALAMGGCGGGGTTPPPGPTTCLLRVADFSATAPNADFYFKGVLRLPNVGYGEVRHYIQLDSGSIRALADSAGRSGVLVDNLGYLTLLGGHTYTLFLYHRQDLNQDLLALRFDDPTAPAAGKARLRKPLNVAMDVPGRIQVLFAGITSPVDPGELSSDYYDVDPGTFPVTVRSAADTNTVYATGSLTMAAGSSYTMVFSGMHSGGPAYRVTVLTDSAYAAFPAPSRWSVPPTAPRLATR